MCHSVQSCYVSGPDTWCRQYKIGDKSALKELDHHVGIDDMSEVRKVWFRVESLPTDLRLQLTSQAVLPN